MRLVAVTMTNTIPQYQSLSPSRTVVTSFTPRKSNVNHGVVDYYEEGDWVLFVGSGCSSSGCNFVCCAMSNGELQIYDQQRLHNIQSYHNVHGVQNSMFTDMKVPNDNQNNHNVIVTSGTDGTIRILDLRMEQQQQPYCYTWKKQQHPSHQLEEALSVSVGYEGTLVAVGSNKGKIHFLDLRKGGSADGSSLVGSYTQSHTDDVTKVYFASSASSNPLLISGSEDGLACIFDTSQPSEEAAIKTICNIQSPIRQLGFMGPNLEGLYCLTGSETMSIWSIENAQCLANYQNIRHDLTNLTIKEQQQQQSTAFTPIEYLVDAKWDIAYNELNLMAGNSNGDACIATIDYGNNHHSSNINNNNYHNHGNRNEATFSSCHLLKGGHRGVLRGWSPLSSSMFVSVGEDARLCEWNRAGRQCHSATTTKATTSASPSVPQAQGSNNAILAETPIATMKTTTTITSLCHNNLLSGNLAGGGPLRRPRNQKRSSGSGNPY